MRKITGHRQAFSEFIPGQRFALLRLAALLLAISFGNASQALSQDRESAQDPGCPPKTKIVSVTDAYGTTAVSDSYRWLEDQDSKDTRAWIEAEQKCADAALSKIPGRAKLADRLTELLSHDSYEPPIERAGRYFFRRRLAGGDLYQVFVQRSRDGKPDLLIDPLAWSPDHSAGVVLENVSKDGKTVFYGRRDGGQDEVTLGAMDVDTGKPLPDEFPKAVYFSLEPAPDNTELYYTIKTPDGPRAFSHLIGSNSGPDRVIFGDGLKLDKILALELSGDGKYLIYLVIYGSGSEQTEIYVQNIKDHGPVIAAVKGEKALFFPSLAGDHMLINTNWKAPRGRVFAASLAAPEREHWTPLISEAPDNLENITPAGGKVIAQYTHNASSKLTVYAGGDGKMELELPLPSIGSVSAPSARWESPDYFFSFESYDSPAMIFRYDTTSKKSALWAGQPVSRERANYVIEQVWFTSKDKTRVPTFLFHKKDLKLDGTHPVLLTGYGGFDSSETPYYWALAMQWVERGGIFADANLRGGAEFGEDWHRAAMFEKKQNVFDDFFAAAEFLIAQHYTVPAKLAIIGQSNGGLLMGAALTQRPELFRAVVCEYPLLDMLRFQKFMDGVYWVPEYGSAENVEQFSYLFKYSPYHRVVDGGKYPATLFVTGDGDTRVAPLHARKMAARLQAANGSEHPILLLYDTKSGHSGGRPVKKQVEEYTDILSFLFWQLGMDSGHSTPENTRAVSQ